MQVGRLLVPMVAVTLMAQVEPSQPLPLAPDALVVARRHLQEWREKLQPSLMDDWGQTSRYRSENARIKAPELGDKRVVFFGDSITEMWNLGAFFPEKQYLNRGIGGQTTSQMLVRFRQDVIALRPLVVVIQAGTNDIAGNTGPISLEDIQGNLTSLAELARANGIHVVLASILPVHNYTSRAADLYVTRPAVQIQAMNRWIKEYCLTRRCTYLDYYTPFLDEKECLKRELSEDGLHLNTTGYRSMANLVESAIQKALTR